MAKDIRVVDEIAKLKNKLKRNEDRINDSKMVSEALQEEIAKLDAVYTQQVAPQMYVSLDVINKQFGDNAVEKVRASLKHVTKLKDFDWQKSKTECWICQSENHLNVCADNSTCDRHLENCIGEKSIIVQVKQ